MSPDPNVLSVVLKLRIPSPNGCGHTDLQDVANEARIRAATKIFAESRLGPSLLAEGLDWYVEEYVGSPLSLDSVSLNDLATLLSRVHEVPAGWCEI
eukprot:SAG31_NODE_19844_length_590_cov_1.020367_1_plen_97_part_00